MEFAPPPEREKFPRRDTVGIEEALPIEVRANFHKQWAGQDSFALLVGVDEKTPLGC